MTTGDWIGVSIVYLLGAAVTFMVFAALAEAEWQRDDKRRWARLAFYAAPAWPITAILGLLLFLAMLPVWMGRAVKGVWDWGYGE